MDISSLVAFLRSTKTNVLQAPSQHSFGERERHVVLGNEASDLDSVVSSIVLAFWIALGAEKENDQSKAPLVIPVINCAREDLPLRTEVTYLLSSCQIPLESLVCRDEIDLAAIHSVGKLKLTLVDHNVLSEGDAPLGAAVIKVIDHHKRDRPYDPRDIIEPVGSCSTLVAELTLGLLDNDPIVCSLLYGTILLDTVNLSPTAKKATPKDFKVISDLEELFTRHNRSSGGSPLFSSRDEFYKPIAAARADISSLTPGQLLRKDCKVLKTPEITIAVPAMPLLAHNFLELEGAPEALKTALHQYRASTLVVMGWEVGLGLVGMSRDLLIFSDSPQKTEAIAAALESCDALGLRAILPFSPHSQELSPYSFLLLHQTNVALSRKFILPFLAKQFDTNKAQSQGDVDALAGVEILLPASDLSPPKVNSSSTLTIPAVSLGGGVNTLAIGDPISHGGSNQSSAYNSCPYTPQNSCAEPADEDLYSPDQTYFLPSFNSREMIEKIKMKRGKLRDYDPKAESDTLSVGTATSYPFTPKNSYVDSTFESYYSAERQQQQQSQSQSPSTSTHHYQSAAAQQQGGILNAIDSEVLLRKLLEKRRTTSSNAAPDSLSSNASSKSQSLTKLNVLDTSADMLSPGGDSPVNTAVTFVSPLSKPSPPFEQQHDSSNN